MKKEGHPEVFNVNARSVCGNNFNTTSTDNKIEVEICSQCHPYFTGAQKFVDTAGRIERFNDRFTKKTTK